MIPIALDPAASALAVAGNGALAARRCAALRAGGAANLRIYAPAPTVELGEAAGTAVAKALPDDAALRRLHALWIVDLPQAEAEALAAAARRLGVLVNVEDQPALCDFHSVAELRRGDLLVTISTGGAAPGLAGVVRRWLDKAFGPEWAGRVADVAALRRQWRAEGVSMADAARRISAMADEHCWFAPAR